MSSEQYPLHNKELIPLLEDGYKHTSNKKPIPKLYMIKCEKEKTFMEKKRYINIT